MRISIVLIGWIAVLSAVAPMVATAGDTEAVETVETVETIEIVQMVEGGGTIEPKSSASGIALLGRFHSAAVHIPIGFLVALLLIELLTLTRFGAGTENTGLFLSVATALSFFPAAITGWLRAEELTTLGMVSTALSSHRCLMIAAFSLVSLAAGMRVLTRKKQSVPLRYSYVGLLIVALILTMWGGHLGGKMVFGENFLPF